MGINFSNSSDKMIIWNCGLSYLSFLIIFEIICLFICLFVRGIGAEKNCNQSASICSQLTEATGRGKYPWSYCPTVTKLLVSFRITICLFPSSIYLFIIIIGLAV